MDTAMKYDDDAAVERRKFWKLFRKLIALTKSPNEHEAESAMTKAHTMMLEKGYRVPDVPKHIRFDPYFSWKIAKRLNSVAKNPPKLVDIVPAKPKEEKPEAIKPEPIKIIKGRKSNKNTILLNMLKEAGLKGLHHDDVAEKLGYSDAAGNRISLSKDTLRRMFGDIRRTMLVGTGLELKHIGKHRYRIQPK